METPSQNPHQMLCFKLHQDDYALDIAFVREIRNWTTATPLPHAPPHVLGVLNLRGQVLPVMDLATCLGFPPVNMAQRPVVIVVRLNGSDSGLVVSSVADIVTITTDQIQTAPTNTPHDADASVAALCLMDQSVIRILDLAQILAHSPATAA